MAVGGAGDTQKRERARAGVTVDTVQLSADADGEGGREGGREGGGGRWRGGLRQPLCAVRCPRSPAVRSCGAVACGAGGRVGRVMSWPWPLSPPSWLCGPPLCAASPVPLCPPPHDAPSPPLRGLLRQSLTRHRTPPTRHDTTAHAQLSVCPQHHATTWLCTSLHPTCHPAWVVRCSAVTLAVAEVAAAPARLPLPLPLPVPHRCCCSERQAV